MNYTSNHFYDTTCRALTRSWLILPASLSFWWLDWKGIDKQKGEGPETEKNINTTSQGEGKERTQCHDYFTYLLMCCLSLIND